MGVLCDNCLHRQFFASDDDDNAFCFPTLATAANSGASQQPAVANAHAVFARFYDLNWHTDHSATLANLLRHGL